MIHIFIGVLLAWLVYNTIYDWYRKWIKAFPPGPLTLPFIGGLYSLDPKSPHLSVDKLVEKYGKIVSVRMGPLGQMVFVQDLELITEIFDSTKFNDRPEMEIFDILNQGAEGIGSCKYDKKWETIYQVLHRGLIKLNTNQLEQTSLHSFSQLIERFSQEGLAGTDYNPRQDLFKAVSALFSSLIYGIEPEDLNSAELQTRIDKHDSIMNVLNPMSIMNVFPFLWKLPSPVKTKLLKILKERDEYVDKRYREHEQDFDGRFHDIMDIIADYELTKDSIDKQDELTKNITKKDFFLSAWTMYLAGCDTTSTVMHYLIFYLCMQPHVQDKIQEEVDNLDDDDMLGTLQQKHKLQYTRAAIYETLRCASTLGVGLPRTSSEDQTLGKYFIPRGTIIMLNQWNLHHNEEFWPEPHTYKPERFLENDSGKLLPNYHIFRKMPFIPFSQGKRKCIGQHLSMDIILIFLVELMKKNTINFPENFVPDLSADLFLSLRPKPFPIECQQRNRIQTCQ